MVGAIHFFIITVRWKQFISTKSLLQARKTCINHTPNDASWHPVDNDQPHSYWHIFSGVYNRRANFGGLWLYSVLTKWVLAENWSNCLTKQFSGGTKEHHSSYISISYVKYSYFAMVTSTCGIPIGNSWDIDPENPWHSQNIIGFIGHKTSLLSIGDNFSTTTPKWSGFGSDLGEERYHEFTLYNH